MVCSSLGGVVSRRLTRHMHTLVFGAPTQALFAEGKQHAMAIGITKMSTAEIREKNAGIGIDSIHCLNDGLWAMDPQTLNLK
eukprot:m.22486 g.22486  ORF g.22486 m.22486 type:complete len:82 (-) comp3991_c0_seq2:124-369(-)